MPVEIVTVSRTSADKITDNTFILYMLLTIISMCIFCLTSLVQQHFSRWTRLGLWIIITVIIIGFLYIDEKTSNFKIFITSLIGLGVDYYFFFM